MQNPPVFPAHVDNKREPVGKILEPGLFAHVRPIFEQYSHAIQMFAGTRDGNLYIRNSTSEDIQIIAKPQPGWYWNMEGARWSPNGKFIVAKQIDDREVPQIKLSHARSDDISYKPYSRAGQNLPKHQFYIVNIETGHATSIDHGLDEPYIHVLGWSNDNRVVRLLRTDRLLKKLSLLVADAGTGKVSTLFSEKSETFLIGLNLFHGYSDRLLAMNLFWFLDEQQQFIYTSERTEFNQLYLYDMQGKLIKPLTNKNSNGTVTQLLEVDIKNGWVYFYAQADDKQPYNTQLFRSSTKINKIEKLIDGPEMLEAFFSPAKDSIWVWHANLKSMMQIDLITSAGKYLQTTWTANLKPLEEVGFNPEYTLVRSADNQTLLEAFILKPKEFDSNKKYPVVEYIYAAPNATVIPRNIFDRSMWNMQYLANAGFIVVMIDARGTHLRGKKFQDYNYGRFGQVEIQEHVSVIKQVAQARPYMDLNRIGIIGHSWGGYFALQALLQAPEFYKVGHINAAAIDPVNFRVAIEPYMGCLPKDCPEKYQQAAVTSKLSNLKAPLMITHGTADDDVPVEEAHKLIAALKAIGYKQTEYIEYQGLDHIVMRDRSWQPTMIDFFVKHFID